MMARMNNTRASTPKMNNLYPPRPSLVTAVVSRDAAIQPDGVGAFSLDPPIDDRIGVGLTQGGAR